MAQILNMPRLSDTMSEGRLIKWHKKEGDKVAPGDVLAEVETDKANMDFESFDEGVLLKILVGDGQTAPVGGPVAIIGNAGEDISGLMKPAAPVEAKPAPAPKPQPPVQEKKAPPPPAPPPPPPPAPT